MNGVFVGGLHERIGVMQFGRTGLFLMIVGVIAFLVVVSSSGG